MIKHIYANGDSFTFGQELGGSDVPKEQFFNHTDYMKENGFVGLIQKHYQIPSYQNEATPGGSNDRIVRQTMTAVIDLLTQYEASEIFVLIGFTELNRREFFNSIEKKHYNYLNNSKSGFSMYDDLFKIYTAYFDDPIEHAQRFTTQILGLQSFLKEKKVPYLFFNSLNDTLSWEYKQLIGEEAIKHVDARRYVHEPFCHMTGKMNLPYGKYGHPLEDGHKAWAEHVIKFIDNDNLLEVA